MKLKTLLLSSATVLALGACNATGDDPASVVQYTDMMTIAQMSDEGTTLTYVPVNDGSNITYVTSTIFNKEIYSVGMRALVLYSPLTTNEWGVGGAITVMASAPALGKGTAPVVAVGDTLSNWLSDEMDNPYLWRTGQYINIAFEDMNSPSPLKFACYVDATTLESAYPELHIVYKQGAPYQERTYPLYGSFDISDIWNRPGIKSVNVHYFGPNGPTKQAFEKMGFLPVQ